MPFANNFFVLTLTAALALGAMSAPAMAQSDDALDSEGGFPAIPDAAPGAAPTGSVGGMGDINIYPRRVVIDARQRIASVGLYNKAIAPGDYEISIVDMVMTTEGRVFAVDNLPEGVTADRLNAASSMLRWSPRRVTLLGNEAQTIRIMARPPADLPDGEYRAHFSVVSLPPETDVGLSIEEASGGAAAQSDQIGVVIRPRFGISIPVIVRLGETQVSVGLRFDGMVDVEEGKALAMTITRSGTRSAYGDLFVTAAGSDAPVAVLRGIGVYPEVDSRSIVVQIDPEFDLSLLRPGTVLTATYVDDDFAPGETLARQEFIVP